MKYLLLLIFSQFFIACKEISPEVKLVMDTKSALGEGAIWNYKTGELYWVNITAEILNIYNPKTSQNKELFTGQMIGTVVPSESGKALVALENGIYQMDVVTGSKIFVINPEESISGNRFNDGKCDPAGRFWAGTLNMDGEKEKAALYRIETDGTAIKVIDSVSVSNGIAWSSNQDRLYYVDTPTGKIMAYDYNNETGAINNGIPVVEISPDMGFPDGMTIDKAGNLWIALWGGSAVGCWNPETGQLIKKIEVPALNVTSCAFGDDDLGTLYITTARQNTNEDILKKYPHAGGLFKVRPGVKGVNAYFFRGDFSREL